MNAPTTNLHAIGSRYDTADCQVRTAANDDAYAAADDARCQAEREFRAELERVTGMPFSDILRRIA
jgi:hypothetical protein